ncbi:DUF4407 domain-containing protein [Aureibaculum sp. 2210JD6-5]|uniref:DUF4407 domain-containing protein n=1 Tax=Aureibaculum sp. 2210JD6-5 TaxID=3103957 RepID=UPI002AAE2A2D|nr:DUF4407 domain-containing protein [Aureibaculum sp. 2210JD6-5]MDY7395890.1 DUF4407 domain-containing protein [Aureibaculum sp. 2210JD6-5]
MLKKFFWMCSGADPDLLDESPKSEQIKYAGIGGTVFFTAVMAFIAGSYALFTVFDNVYIAIAFGLVWGLLIFNLDRFIVSTIKKRDNLWQELLQASPRIVLAIIIAVVISKPLEMKIFEKEINQVLLEQKNELTLQNQNQIAEQYSPEIGRIESEINSLKSEIDNKEKEVNDLYNTYITEAEGTSGTMKLGKGPVYKEKREKHDALLQELQQLKADNTVSISEKEATVSQLRLKQDQQVAKSQPIIDGFDGLMARINALGELAWFPSFFIFLLFVAIETAPVLAKIMASKGAYDLKYEEQEDALKVWVTQQKNQRAELLSTDTTLNEKVYYNVAEDEEIYNYKKQKAKDLLKLQSEKFFKKQSDIIG